ncbi:ABC transporter ATP-binding protein [Alkaliphilus peptidifermentans]|uniref:Iron(III) transport system ATP-binding protein n=1 Tax=Alkaliphilus peptidifermentans DSM 18978 TaxID=1120976 RepID=A0A1G5L3W7_9FIRM|nr:ABC transporter ATP-binding protein [Alkaliphilus peptidifermentans]SCZ07643.1 iron(III) transport system ATP-binding protein [Alkaliphilus peptidifermentans DSM 18978]
MITFDDINIMYGDFIAIKDLNLTINEGEFFTLLGPSGCGKTTTLRSLVGFVKPFSGNIIIEGNRVNDKPIEERNIGIVFQSYALFPTMNVFDNIAFGLKLQKKSKCDIEKSVKDIAMKVDLNKEQLSKKVSELSGGQQQRVAIARALVMKPKILALDEPLSNLDANLRGQLRVELKRLQREFGITTIYVTHDQEEALTISDRIAVFNKGFLEQVGTPKDIYNNSKTEFVTNFIGDINLLQVKIKTELGVPLENKAYIRLEKVYLEPPFEDLTRYQAFEVMVLEKEYYGNYSKYTFKYKEELVRNYVMENERYQLNVGDNTKIYIDKKAILQFKE